VLHEADAGDHRQHGRGDLTYQVSERRQRE